MEFFLAFFFFFLNTFGLKSKGSDGDLLIASLTSNINSNDGMGTPFMTKSPCPSISFFLYIIIVSPW